MRCTTLGLLLACAALPLNACTGDIGGGAAPKAAEEDTGVPAEDTGGTPGEDTGTPAEDTGTPPEDTGPAAEYPAGPYGGKVGQVYPDTCFMGYRDGVAGKSAGKWENICLKDYYDPSGSKKITAIRIIGAALW